MLLKNMLMLSVFSTACVLSLGCGKPAEKSSGPGTTPAADSHASWWCIEHGVPEEVCALCSSKLAAEFKANGDWCKEHERPESQCFACHPELDAEFAAQYEAKYGQKPPKPLGVGEPHDHDHNHDHEDEKKT